MKQLIILCHPSTESLCQSIAAELVQLYEEHEIKVKLRDLYKMKFQPILTCQDLDEIAANKVSNDVAIEQEHISDADIITFIYPIWHNGMPAMLRGYIERVFCEGFAYSINKKGRMKKLLEDKKVVLINTFNSLKNLAPKEMGYNFIFTNERHIFESFGMEIMSQHFIEKANLGDGDNVINSKIKDLKKEIKSSIIVGNNIRLNIPTTFF